MSNKPKAKLRYNKSTDLWNVFVEANGKDVPVGTTAGNCLAKDYLKQQNLIVNKMPLNG